MNRRRFLALAGALGAAAAAGACGVPGSGEPVYVGTGPTAGTQLGGALEPPKPSAADSARNLVENYFKAAAGANYTGADKPDALAQAKQRALDYMTAAAQQGWQPGKDLTVVRAVLGEPQVIDGIIKIKASLYTIGVLNDRGALEPSKAAAPSELDFNVVQVGVEFRLDKAPPPQLLLSDEGLQELYTARQIYFWEQIDNQSPTLVPDQRYLPKSIATAKQPAEIVRWLTAGPSPLVASVVQPLPDLGVKETSYGEDGRLMVNLSSNAATLDADAKHRLAVQLRWSVNPLGAVDLRIEGTPTNASTDDYASFNLAASNTEAGNPERFCIENGKVIADPKNAGPTPILAGDENKDAVAAAMPRNKRNLAVVRVEGKNQRLWLATLSGTGETRALAYVSTDVYGPPISRPVWITRPIAQALIAVNGEIRAVPAPTSNSGSPVPGLPVNAPPGGLPGKVTALAVSPEGRRIALIAGGQVVVAGLQLNGNQISIADGYRIVRTNLSKQHAVGWSDETRLVVGGDVIASSKITLVEIAIDGSGQQSLPRQTDGLDGWVVNMLSVRPASPLPLRAPRFALFDSNGTALVVYGASISPLTFDGQSPTPARKSAPFFLD